MRILWIVNIEFPEALELLKIDSEFTSSGGWLLAAAEALSNNDSIRLFVASASSHVKQLTRLEGKRIIYYLVPSGHESRKYNKTFEYYWKEIKKREKPNVIHIHGTEFPYGLSYLIACGNQHTLVTLQGISNAISKYYTAGLSNWDIIKYITFRDLFGRTIWHEKGKFTKQGLLENEILKRCNHIVGRTAFDRAYVHIINPEAQYYVCNETLREDFYIGQWERNRCTPNTIFLSQAWYPLKGAHQVFKAMPFILERYPNAKIRIAGYNILKTDTIQQRLRLTGYANYLRSLIKSLHIEDKIEFIGPLTAGGIKRELLSCNVFVCPSSIENSSNSLAEAQILGVPCVASYVGGLPSIMKGDETHLYRFEDIEMLAYLVSDIFDGNFNSNMRDVAIKRHDPSVNLERLMEIYNIVHNE